MGRMDAQAEVRRRLAAALPDVEVRVTVPDPRPARLVVVRREGGPLENRLIDRPGIGVQCWAPTEAEASALAARVSDAMLSLPFSAGFATVEETVMRSDPDMRSGSPRWYASYTLRTFKPRV